MQSFKERKHKQNGSRLLFGDTKVCNTCVTLSSGSPARLAMPDPSVQSSLSILNDENVQLHSVLWMHHIVHTESVPMSNFCISLFFFD